jgi:DNA ligase-associated metallophosphoesterase
MVPFSFAGEDFALLSSGALFWRRMQTLLVADLHLEKGSYYARDGQFVPPYDSRETLVRLADAVRATGARSIVTLGDNFHDDDGCERLEPHARGMLETLTRAIDFTWITGNHDPFMAKSCGGRVVEELRLGEIALRHQAAKGESGWEMSGHFHPKLTLTVRGRRISRPCAVAGLNGSGIGGGRLILPAFGALTGGMPASDPAIIAALHPAREIDAVLPAGQRLVRFALWRSDGSHAAPLQAPRHSRKALADCVARH